MRREPDDPATRQYAGAGLPPSQPYAAIARHGLAPDLLRGADQIAAYLFGSAGERRKVYHLAETSRLPVFRLGSLLCARRTTLLAWIEAQERGAPPDANLEHRV